MCAPRLGKACAHPPAILQHRKKKQHNIMNKIFTKEIKIALTAIVAIVLLFVGINFLKGVNLFKKSNLYIIKFNDITGLAVSNPVYANGYAVGIVREITYDYDHPGNVAVGVELDSKMRVPAGTRAELATEMLGGAVMNLVLGPDPLHTLEPGDTIPGGPKNGLMNKLEQAAPTVMALIPKLDSILTNINRITGDPALMQTLNNAAELTAQLKTTTASVNHLLKNDVPQLTAKLNRIGSNMEVLSGHLANVPVEETMRNVNETLASVHQLSKNMTDITNNLNNSMSSKDNTLGLLLNDRKLYDNINTTISSADSLVTDLKANPKRYVHFSLFGRKGN